MKEAKTKYRVLVHCLLGQIREGFNTCVDGLPFPVSVQYADLGEEGIVSKLRFDPHLIVLLLNKEDSEIILPAKIKLFAAGVPLLVIVPQVPEAYLLFLKKLGVEKIIELPADNRCIGDVVTEMLQREKVTDFRD